MPKQRIDEKIVDQLVEFAKSRRLEAADLTEPLEIHPDRLNNGGLVEIITLALEDDDPDWIMDQIDRVGF